MTGGLDMSNIIYLDEVRQRRRDVARVALDAPGRAQGVEDRLFRGLGRRLGRVVLGLCRHQGLFRRRLLLKKLPGAYRFCQVTGHTGLAATLPIFGYGVGCHGDDGAQGRGGYGASPLRY